MKYKVTKALLIMEDSSRRNIELNNKVNDLDLFKKTLISEYNAKEIYLNYEQEDNTMDCSSLSDTSDSLEFIPIN